MRKFKIKNRKKRKYTRRKSLQSSFYLSKSASIGLIPPLFIIFAIFIIFTLSMPSIPSMSLESFYQNISQIILPQINIARLLEQTKDALYTLTDAFTEFITYIVQMTLNLSHLLDPRPLIRVILNTLITILIEFEKIARTVVQTIEIGFKNMLLYTTHTASTLTTLFSSLIYSIVLSIILTSKIIIITIGNKIIESLNQIIIMIESPFIKIAKDLQFLSPFTTKVIKIIRDSAYEVFSNMVTIFKFILQNSKNI